jgi:hypothetical protein
MGISPASSCSKVRKYELWYMPTGECIGDYTLLELGNAIYDLSVVRGERVDNDYFVIDSDVNQEEET